MIRPTAPLAAAALLVTLAGCARDAAAGDYPSLARRAAEARGFAEPDLPPAPPATADPALDARLATMRTRVTAVAAGFDRDAAAAGRAATSARGRAVGSEPWLAAQSALAQLDDWRAQVSALASEADAIAVERAAALAPDYPTLAAVRAVIRGEAERETAEINRLQALTPAA